MIDYVQREIDIIKTPDTYWYASKPTWTGERDYVLPYGPPKVSPFDVEHMPYGADNQLALVCTRTDQPRTRPSRLIFTGGGHRPDTLDRIGCSFRARHDQTGALLGTYAIVGIVAYGIGGHIVRIEGSVPDVKLALNTYK